MGAYGKTYELTSRDKHNIGDLAAGPGSPGEFTSEPGTIAYFEVSIG